MASSTSSLSRASLRPSPSNSMQKADNSIESLISYLVASKRSLASIHLVQRATTILSDARSGVESATVVAARTTYLRRSLASQIKILRGVQFELEEGARAVSVEFESVLQELDATDKRLRASIETLLTTRIEEGFKATTEAGQEQTEPKNTLHDFVDAQPVEELRQSLETAIDEVQHAKQEMEFVVDNFDSDLQAISYALSDKTASSSSTRSDLQPPDIQHLLYTLEDHAREMAEGLESLVKHFDLCVSAIKHTEGGSAAVAQRVQNEDLPEGVAISSDFNAPAESTMHDDERTEMMAILATDASEVDEVVMEIQSRHADMERSLEQLQGWKEHKESLYDDIAKAFTLLEKLGSKLPAIIADSVKYTNHWTTSKARLEDAMAGMDSLTDVYSNFSHAYDGLIVEVARRRSSQRQMNQVVSDAQAKLDALYDADQGERELFHAEQGNFLPSDIWRGLTSAPPKFTFSRMDIDPGNIPDLPRKIVEDALKRLKSTALRDGG